MKKRGDGFYGKGYMKTGYAFSKEGAEAGALVDCALGLREVEVSTSPVLLQSC